MSRSGYSDDNDDQWAMIRWRGAVKSAMRGRRGQAFLRELVAALEAMPEKRLIAQTFGDGAGSYCTLGVVCASRGIEVPVFTEEDFDEMFDDPSYSRELASRILSIPNALAAEIMFYNDDGAWDSETPEQRWERMRKWVSKRIKEPTT